MNKNKNFRMCISCREHKLKEELIRIVKTPDGFKVDNTGKMNGRGAYVCKRGNCMDKAFDTKAFNRSFKCEITKEEIQVLREMLSNIDE